MKNIRFKYIVALLAGIAALFLPLVRDFHVESAILAATVGAFWGGWSAFGKQDKTDLRRAAEICGHLYLAGIPLLIYALLTGCYTFHGLGFWLFLPIPSVFLGVGIGRLIRFLRLPAPRFWVVLVLLLVSFGVLLFEFLNFPQLYFFNHVWGYWPGPIYDVAVEFPASLVAFRFITLCWILIIWLIPILHEDAIYKWIVGLSVLGLLLSYSQMEQLRLITPDHFLQQQLGGEIHTESARLFYAERAYTDEEIDRLARETEFYIYQVKQAINIQKPDSATKIELYLYADPWQKKKLVGAKYTSYVTVWQQVPQIHIAKEQLGGSMKHEVVHAATALLDWPGLVPNIGLTEGIAVALDPDRSPESTIDQLVAAKKPYPTAEQMQSALSYWGFYTSRSAVSYTTAGSFVRYLVETRPPQEFVEAYRCGSVKQAYSEPFDQLINGWHRRLDSVRVDSSDRSRASRIFGQPSIFEQECPHKIPYPAQLLDRYRLQIVREDTAAALATLTELKQLDGSGPGPNLLWMLWNLRSGNSQPVIRHADVDTERIEAQLLAADAYRMEQRFDPAKKHLYRAVELAARQNDSTFQEAIAVRMDSLQWALDLRLRYQRALLDSSSFSRAYYRSKIRAVENALQKNGKGNQQLELYATKLLGLPVDLDYFDSYLAMIHRLAFNRHFVLADQWMEKLASRELSLRYRERLDQQREWVSFMKASGIQKM